MANSLCPSVSLCLMLVKNTVAVYIMLLVRNTICVILDILYIICNVQNYIYNVSQKYCICNGSIVSQKYYLYTMLVTNSVLIVKLRLLETKYSHNLWLKLL